MTLDEARQNVGAGVVYDAAPHLTRIGIQHDQKEDGTISSVGDQYVFVRYGHSSVKATPAESLTLLAGSAS